MPTTPSERASRRDRVITQDRRLLAAWIGVFEKSAWSTEPAEIVSTLMNISAVWDDNPEALTEGLASTLRRALARSALREDEEIMAEVRDLASLYPKSHWWWWPQRWAEPVGLP